METHVKWEENINQAKQIIKTTHSNQMEVARLALEVCEITWGGRNNRYGSEAYTVKRFAKEVGMHPSTLSNWIAIRKKIYESLTIQLQKKATYTDMWIVAREVGFKKSKHTIQKHMERHLSNNTFDRKIRYYLKQLKSLRSNFKDASNVKKLEPDTMQELKFYLKSILSRLNGVEAKDHNLVAITNRSSAAKLILGGTVKSKRKNNQGEWKHARKETSQESKI